VDHHGDPAQVTTLHPEHSPNFSGAHGVIMQVEASKLLPWLMLIAMLSGTAVALSVMTIIYVGHNQSDNDRATDIQYRHMQELRSRVEDAEMAAKEVNPTFKFSHQPKEH
jgi:hypothetical protein